MSQPGCNYINFQWTLNTDGWIVQSVQSNGALAPCLLWHSVFLGDFELLDGCFSEDTTSTGLLPTGLIALILFLPCCLHMIYTAWCCPSAVEWLYSFCLWHNTELLALLPTTVGSLCARIVPVWTKYLRSEHLCIIKHNFRTLCFIMLLPFYRERWVIHHSSSICAGSDSRHWTS